jgi:hypothetical protein
MSKNIACGVVVAVLLVLWPAVALAQATKDREAKQMFLMEEYFVFPDKAEEFEALTKEMTGVFATHDFPFRFATYKMDDLRYLGMWLIDGTAGIDALHAAWYALVEEWGEENATPWAEQFNATMSHWKSSVWKTRPDLSYMPENQADPFAYIVQGVLPIKPGHQKRVEVLFREYVKVFAEHAVPHAWRAAEGFIGVDNPTLAFVEWSATPGSYWLRHDENMKNEELSKKTDALWQEMLPHIRGFDWVAGWYRKDLSYRPEKKEQGN